MYFWFRLIGYLMTMWLRKPLNPPFDVSCLHYRAWPFDIDASFHMNNARYAVLADIGRFDLVVRMGIGNVIFREGYSPVLLFGSTRYRREIRNFETFKVETRLVSWKETEMYIEHKFTLTSGKHAGQVSALMLCKAGLYSRKKRAFITIGELMEHAGISETAPPLPPSVEALLAADEAMRNVTIDNNKQNIRKSA